MHARNRTWLLGSDPVERCRQRTMNVEGGDGSTLSLDFTTGVLDPRLTFTRSTNATFINSQGYVQYANANLILQSESLATTPWSKQATTPAVQVADVSITNPIGRSTATEITSGGANGAVLQSPTIAGVIPHTIRFWIRAGTSSRLEVGYFSGAFQTGTATVVSGGTATIVGSSLFLITNLTSTWTQIQIVLSAPASGGSLLFYPDTAGSPVSGRTLYIWGVQMNAGMTASPYYQTTTAVYQAPRFDYDPTTLTPRGLLIEGSAINIALYSANLPTGTNWVANSITRSDVSTVTPDGNTTATTCGLTHTGAGSFRSQGLAVSASTVYTFSFWAKNNGGSVALYRVYNVSGSAEIVSETSYFSNINSSTWTRIQVSFTTPVGCTSIYIYPLSQSSGTSNLLIWGAQLEAGSGASSYIPTGASQGSRAEDTCYADGTNFSSWYNASTQTGTLFADITHSALSNVNGGIELGNGLGSQTTSNRVSLRRDVVIVDGVSSLTVSPTGASQRFKTAISFAPGTGNTAACRNGGTVSNPALAAGTLTGINALKLYVDSSSALRPYGWIRQVKVWPIALSNATIQAITTI